MLTLLIDRNGCEEVDGSGEAVGLYAGNSSKSVEDICDMAIGGKREK